MRKAALPAVAAFLSIVIGCAEKTSMTPFNVVIRGPAASCGIEVEGRKVTSDELLDIARAQARAGRSAHVSSDIHQNPYRCIGGVIYTLERAGFKNIVAS